MSKRPPQGNRPPTRPVVPPTADPMIRPSVPPTLPPISEPVVIESDSDSDEPQLVVDETMDPEDDGGGRPAVPTSGPAGGSAGESLPGSSTAAAAKRVLQEDSEDEGSSAKRPRGAESAASGAHSAAVTAAVKPCECREVFNVAVRRNAYAPRDTVTVLTRWLATGPYRMPGDYYDAKNAYYLRVPALMFMEADLPDTAVATQHMRNGHRHQFGTHLYIKDKGEVQYLRTAWIGDPTAGETRQYQSCDITALTAVYPCKTVDNASVQLGLNFVDRMKGPDRPRSFVSRMAYLKNDQMPNPYVFDLTEVGLGDGIIAWTQAHKDVYPFYCKVTAYYVCRGARLVVIDDRTYKEQKDYEVRYNYQLFQQGSVVVVVSDRREEIGIYSDAAMTKPWTEYAYKTSPNPEALDSEEAKEPTAPDFKGPATFENLPRRVVFLGAVESQYNSVCWQFRIDRKLRGAGRRFKPTWTGLDHSAVLRVPEGGYFEDLTTWELGWQLIAARHKYERLFDELIEETVAGSASAQPFTIPADQYLLNRILNVQVQDTPCRRSKILNLDYQSAGIPDDFYHLAHDFDNDFRRYSSICALNDRRRVSLFLYNEQYMSAPNWPQLLPSPPLYPPILDNSDDQLMRMRSLGTNDKVVPHNPATLNPPDHNLIEGSKNPLKELWFSIKDPTGAPIDGHKYRVTVVPYNSWCWDKGTPPDLYSVRLTNTYLTRAKSTDPGVDHINQSAKMHGLFLVKESEAQDLEWERSDSEDDTKGDTKFYDF